MASHDIWLPSESELTVQEINISAPAMRAASVYMNLFCEPKCKEYMLCRNEEEDPRKCLKEGADVTACGIKFLQKVKKNCRQEFEKYAHCIEHRSANFNTGMCRNVQRYYDQCMWEKMEMKRPVLGYFAKTHLHETDRPKPAPKSRDYKAEAAKVVDELPEDYPIREDYKNYRRAGFDFFHP